VNITAISGERLKFGRADHVDAHQLACNDDQLNDPTKAPCGINADSRPDQRDRRTAPLIRSAETSMSGPLACTLRAEFMAGRETPGVIAQGQVDWPWLDAGVFARADTPCLCQHSAGRFVPTPSCRATVRREGCVNPGGEGSIRP
jgi:hypothetical protein